MDVIKVTSPQQIEIIESKNKEPKGDEVLIQVKACGICGSDLHIYKGLHPNVPLPAVIGHELSGEVVKVGSNVTDLKIGDRVCVEPLLNCGSCYFCMHGYPNRCVDSTLTYRVGKCGFSKYFVANASKVYKLPNTVTYEEGAMIEPLSVALHAVRLSGIQVGHTVAIFGAGTIGLLILQTAIAAGASKVFITDLEEPRLQLAKKFGAYETVNAKNKDPISIIREKTQGLGVNVAFEAVGIQNTFMNALMSVKKGGTIVILGVFEKPQIEIYVPPIVNRELTIKGSFLYADDFKTAISLVESKSINLLPLISQVLPLKDIKRGFKLLQEDKSIIKVIIKPS